MTQGRLKEQSGTATPRGRFPYFATEPVSYLRVKMNDHFWAPRQRTAHEVSVAWLSRHHDQAGGLEKLREDPEHYVAQTTPSDMEHIKCIEALATVVGIQPDPAIVALIGAWAEPLVA